ncbi:MAG: CBS domain-containing protein [Hyphomicrobiales bacterium]|jgi:CBS domain-containing protein|nr:CBS domain-containing protein [Hyphomicrobiales bacterium]|tara:strand:+ start:4094 stop:4627 length:534 start_codon:yes stop_codon:yes gene_type:complete
MATRIGTRLIDRPEFKLKAKPITFLKTEKVFAAIQVMSKKNYGSVVIVDKDNTVIGIVTERDILKRLVGKSLDPKTTILGDIMTEDPKVASEEDDVLDWLRIMSNERFRRLPVVDSEGKIKVIFTQGDFVSYTWPDLLYHAKQLAKASLLRGFPIYGIIAMVLLYSIAMIFVFNYLV